MIRALVVCAVLAVALAVRVVVVPDVRLDGALVVPVLIIAAVVIMIARRAERRATR